MFCGWWGTQHWYPSCHDQPLVGQETPDGGDGGLGWPPCLRQHDFCWKLASEVSYSAGTDVSRHVQEFARPAVLGGEDVWKGSRRKQQHARETSHY